MEEKRIRVGAIIINDGKIVSMYREREDRIYYTFPGGGKEENETEEEGAKREVFEEFGMIVELIKKVYTYERKNCIEHYYLAKWIGGEFGTGEGEEYEENQTNGVYIPKWIEISDIPNLPLMPPEIATAFYEDYQKNGTKIRDDVKVLFGEIR